MVDGHVGQSSRVRDVVRDVVAEVAPDEIPLVEGLWAFDDATVVRRLRRVRRSDDPLGFGLGEVVASLTPVAWLVLDEVGRRIVAQAADGAAKHTKARWRKLFRRPEDPVRIPPLTAEQLAEVRRLVIEAAGRNDVDAEPAERLADAVVARLATRDPQ